MDGIKNICAVVLCVDNTFLERGEVCLNVDTVLQRSEPIQHIQYIPYKNWISSVPAFCQKKIRLDPLAACIQDHHTHMQRK